MIPAFPPVPGFYGKIPSRGDFVRAGLPRSFVDPWDLWMQTVLAGSRAALGEAWVQAWMEAPVWRFLLQPGACGPDAAYGVFMPSVDRAGRYFPLMLARAVPGGGACAEPSGSWLAVAEAAGLAALEHDLEPDAIAARIESAASAEDDVAPPHGPCAWWTDGAPRVGASAFATASLPDAVLFARMLDAQTVDESTAHPIAAPRS